MAISRLRLEAMREREKEQEKRQGSITSQNSQGNTVSQGRVETPAPARPVSRLAMEASKERTTKMQNQTFVPRATTSSNAPRSMEELQAALKQARRTETEAKRTYVQQSRDALRVGDKAQVDALMKSMEDAVSAREALEREIERNEYYDKYSTTTYDDNFHGQFRANKAVGRLNQDVNAAYNEYLQNPTETNRKYADALALLDQQFQTNNAEALDDEGAVLPWITQSAAGYLPQLWDQTKATVGGGAAGALGGAGVGSVIPVVGTGTGAVWGGRAGAVAASGAYSYGQMRGAAFRELVNAGWDEETARAAANDEAVISALIEMGDTAWTVMSLGTGKLLETLGKGGIKAVAGESAEIGAKKLLKELAKFGIKDVGGEAVEEGLQQGVSIANKDRDGTGIWNLLAETASTFRDAATGENDAARDEILDAAGEGAKIALMFGGAGRAVDIAGSNIARAKIGKTMQAMGGYETVQAMIETGLESDKNTESYQLAVQMKAKLDSGKTLSNIEIGRLQQANVKAIEAEASQSASDGLMDLARETVAERENAAQPQADAAVEGNPGSNVPYNVLSMENPVRKARDNAIKNTGYGENGIKAFTAELDRSGESVDQVRAKFQTAYELGRFDTPREKVSLETELQQIAYNAGRLDYIADMGKQVNTSTAGAKSGFDTTGAPSFVTSTQARIVDDLAKALGSSVVIGKSKGNAEINSRGAVVIADDFQTKVGGQDVSIVYHAAHEIGMHRLMQLAPTEGRAFLNAMYNYMSEGRPQTAATLIEEKQSAYAEQDVTLTTDKAAEEVVANNILSLYENEEAFGEAVRRIANGNDQQAKRGLEKFREILDDIVKKLRGVIAKLTGKEKAEAKHALGEVEHLREMYENALAAAVKKNRELTAEKNATQESDAEYVTTADGLKYSLKMDFEDQVDAALTYELEKDAAVYVMDTPEMLQALGLKEYPVLMTQKHIRDAVHEKSPTNKRYHGLTVDMVKRLPELLENPVMMLRSLTDEDSVVIVTAERDSDNLPVIIAVKPNGVGRYNRVDVVTNFAVSMYGRSNFGSFIDRTIKADGVLYVNKKRTRSLFARSGLKMPQALNKDGFFSDSIAQQEDVVNGDTQEGVQYSIKGEKANLSAEDKANLHAAKKMQEDGKSNEEIYKETGWYTQSDGKWRTEIPDEIMIPQNFSRTGLQSVKDAEADEWLRDAENRFKNGAISEGTYKRLVEFAEQHRIDDADSGSLPDFLDAPQLYDAYPQLRKTKLWFKKLSGMQGYTDAATNQIVLDPDGLHDAGQTVREGLAHEIQHIIQSIEGFTRGSTPGDAGGYEAYRKTGGEVEARDVESRLRMTPEDRRRNMPTQFSLKDSTGRTLSPGQQEYFKDSKVRDENGNLKVVYHGSPADFNTFSLDYLGTNGTAEGYGFYFTDKRSIAEGYSSGREGQQTGQKGKLFEVYLDIKKPLSDTKVTIPRAKFRKFLTELNKLTDEDGEPLEFLSNYGDVSWEGLNAVLDAAMEAEYDGSDNDVSMISSIINGFGQMERVYDVLRKVAGYDGIIVDKASWGGDQSIYITFRSEQAKNVDNLNPTDDPDVRYSLKEGATIEEMEARISELNSEYQKMEWKEREFKATVEYNRFMEDIDNRIGDEEYKKWLLEAFPKWMRESGYDELSKRMNSVREEIKTINRSLTRAKEQAAKEARLANRAKYNEEFNKKYASKAARKFGTTGRFDLAGYLTVNGSLLDFSEGQGYRVQDHREIAEVLDFLPEDHGYSDGLIEFMNMGNIRLQSYGIDISKAPNAAQRSKLRQFFQLRRGEIAVDFSDENGLTVGSNEYNEGTSANKILADIDAYFETGEVPNQSIVSQFHSQFSLKEQNDLLKENAKLKEVNEGLREQFKTTKFAQVDKKSLDKFTKQLLKDYQSGADINEIRDALNDVYTYMANGEDGQSPAWNDLQERAYNVAVSILENASTVNDEMYQAYKSLRDRLRNYPISIDKAYNNDIQGYESINDFRKANFGRLKISNDGTPVDIVYSDLANTYPEFFDETEYTTQADQLTHIADVLDSLQPYEVNPYSSDMRRAATWLASDIIERFYELPQAKPTFADKQAAKLTKQVIKDAKKLENLREKKNERIKDLIVKNREKVKATTQKERAKRVEAVKEIKDHYKAKEKKASESRKARELRAKIMRHAQEMSKKLLKPTDKQHIPQKLQGAVAKLLESINLESKYTVDPETGKRQLNGEGDPTQRTKAFAELRKLYAEMANELVIDPDLLGEDGLLSDVAALADKRIADMTSEELETVYQTMRAVEASISSANKAFAESRWASIEEAAESIREENKDKRQVTEYAGVVGWGQKLTGLDMMTPNAFFHRLGESGDAIFRMMRDAQDKHIKLMKAVEDFTHKELKDVPVKNWEKEIRTVKLGGEDVQLTTAQIMELYVLTKRKQAQDHIFMGGILPETVANKGIKKISRAEPVRGIDIGEVSKAVAMLTEEQKKVADKLQQFASTELSRWGNEAAMQVYNYEKFNEPVYWPIRSNRQEIASTVEKDTQVTSVAGRGFSKNTKPNANTSVKIGSIFDTFASHSSEMATYAAWLAPAEDINRIRNYTFLNEEGGRAGTVKGIIERIHGSRGTQYLQKLLSDIANGVGAGRGNETRMDQIVGNYKASAIGANLRVIIQQPTALLRALDMIGPQYIASTKSPLSGWKKAKKYAPIAQWKDWGYFDINTGRQMKDVLFDTDGALDKVKQFTMAGAGLADSISWGMLWNAVENEVKANRKSLKPGTEEFYKAVAARFTEIVDRTQVVDGILQRSQIMRSADGLTKMATSFMGEPTKQYNMVMSALYDLRHTEGRERTIARKRFGRTVTALVVSGVVNAMAQSIIDAVRDDDDEKEYWEKWLTAFFGLEGDEETLGEKAKAVAFGSNLMNIFNPAGYIPYAKDVVSIFQGYDVSRMDMESIEKTISSWNNLWKAINGEGNYTIQGASINFIAEAARLFGVPVANLKREIVSFTTMIAQESDSFLMQYHIDKFFTNPENSSKGVLDILYNAYATDKDEFDALYKRMLKDDELKTEDKTTAESIGEKLKGRLIDDLYELYKTDDNAYEDMYNDLVRRDLLGSRDKDDPEKYKSTADVIATAMENRMKDEQGVTKVEDLDARYFGPEQQREYDSKMREIQSSGVWKNANEEQRDKLEDNLRRVVLESDEDMMETIEEGAAYGLDDTEYLLYKLALETVDQPSENGNLGSYTNAEKAAALTAAGLGDGEIAYLWNDDQALEAFAYGVDMDKYITFKANVGNFEADKDRNGKSITGSLEEKIVAYLNSLGLSHKDYLYLYSTKYKKVKEWDSYKRYFGE